MTADVLGKWYMLKGYLIKDFSVLWPYFRIGVMIAAVLILLHVFHEVLHRRKMSIKKNVALFMFIIYIVMVIGETFLTREPGSRTGAIDLELWSTWGNTWRTHLYVLENVFMFVPMGALMPIIWKKQRKLYFILPTLVLETTFIEFTQYMTMTGYCQLDDVVTNTIGGLIGYIIYLVALR